MRCSRAAAIVMTLVISLSAETRLSLEVPADTPLQLYLNKRVRIRDGQPVQATLIRPVYAADSVVIPAGTKATGQIVSFQPASKMRRTTAILNGDFTPQSTPYVRFQQLTLPNGQS